MSSEFKNVVCTWITGFCNGVLVFMITTNLVRFYVLAKAYLLLGRMPCFEDSVGTVKPHLITHNADIYILVYGSIIGYFILPIVLLIFAALKSKKGVLITIALLLLDNLLKKTDGFGYLMDI